MSHAKGKVIDATTTSMHFKEVPESIGNIGTTT